MPRRELTPEEQRIKREKRRAYDNTPERIAARKAYNREYGQANKKRIWAATKADPEKLAKRYAATRAWRTGMTADQFGALMLAQNSACAICHQPFTGERKGERKAKNKGFACADHCHDGGGPRGLLCPTCNSIEGHIRLTGLSVQDFCARLHSYLADPPFKRVSS